MNRIEENVNNGNEEEEGQPILDFFDQTIFPLMCVTAIAPLQLKEEYSLSLGALPYLNQSFKLNLSIFRREAIGPAHMTFVISSSNILIPPELFSMVFDDIEGEEAKRFMLSPFNKFHPFKKAILLFDKRPYLLVEFENIVMKWKESLKEAL